MQNLIVKKIDLAGHEGAQAKALVAGAGFRRRGFGPKRLDLLEEGDRP